jgi:hypothetical protein
LRLFLRVVEQGLRAHSPGSGPAARLGAVAFIHRFGSTLNAHLHFHCVVIEGVFESDPAGSVIFRAATGLDANAIAAVQAAVRHRLLRTFVRRGLLTPSRGGYRPGHASGDRTGRATPHRGRTGRRTGPPPRRPLRLGAAARPHLRSLPAPLPAARFRLRMLFVILRAECGLRIRRIRCSIKASKS